jgi:hypothetical protein
MAAHKNQIIQKGRPSGGSIDPADVLVENEMLRAEMQKMHDKMKMMEKVSAVTLITSLGQF